MFYFGFFKKYLWRGEPVDPSAASFVTFNKQSPQKAIGQQLF